MKKEVYLIATTTATIIFFIWYRGYKNKKKKEALTISQDDYNLILMKNKELNKYYSTRHFYLKNYE